MANVLFVATQDIYSQRPVVQIFRNEQENVQTTFCSLFGVWNGTWILGFSFLIFVNICELFLYLAFFEESLLSYDVVGHPECGEKVEYTFVNV